MKWIVAFIVAATAAVGLAYYATHRGESPAASTSSVRFREASQPADLTFHMSFLPQEQGETFKVNLYDHGCGVAVGDYDGDGHDDIYFLNQLGGNALYRNRGDGTFIDVTAIVGPVALDDR